MPEPWPPEVRWSFLRLLASGRSGGRRPRAAGPGGAALPAAARSGTACAPCRSATPGTATPSTGTWSRRRPRPRELTRDVDRPDLLLVAALLHDIGKGWPGDHSEVGRADRGRDRRADGLLRGRRRDAGGPGAPPPAAARRPPPGATSTTPPPSTASRRPSAHDAAVLQLLHALAQADGAATSASAWSPWKAHLVAALVARVQAQARRRAAAGARAGAAADRRRRSPRRRWTSPAPTAPVTVGIEDVADGQQVTIGAPDRPRPAQHLRRGAGAQPARRPRRQDDASRTATAPAVFAVRPRFGRAPVPEILADAVRAALEGTLPLADRLRQREADYRQDGGRAGARRGSPGTTGRSAGRRPASSRCAPATGPGCCTG